MRVLRRYAPLLVVLAVVGILVGLLPSTAPAGSPLATASSGFRSPYADTATTAAGALGLTANPAGSAAGSAAGTGAGTGAATGAASGAGLPTGGGASTGAATGGSAAGPAGTPGSSADVGHCVDGRQFDPAIDYYAPPCVPTSNGKNPGPSYQGVTGSQITVVDYYPQGNPAVDTSEKLQGLYVSMAQQQQWDDAAGDFINSHYELYGRKVKIEVVQGSCSTIPPDTACLRSEMKSIVAQYRPYLFRWISPLTSAPFDELSSLGVVNVGGIMFTDSFSAARRPYHWDLNMSGTRIADEFGQWWCNQMSGQSAAYSAAPPGAATVDGQRRVLGVIGTDDPEDILVRQELDQVLHSCGDRVYHTYDASNDLSTAAEQMQASVAAMRQSPQSTTVLCLCNPVGAEFVYNEMQQQQYYPEVVYAGTVYTDLDDAGQAMMTGSSCPSGQNCSFAKAFGLQTSDPREPVGHDTAQRVWTATGRSGPPPFPGTQLDWEYWNMIGGLLQGAGPDLTPANMEQGAFAAGQRGGGTSGHPLRAFSPGDYAWTQDARLTYWDPARVSPFNGRAGTFVPVTPWVPLGGWSRGLIGIPAART